MRAWLAAAAVLGLVAFAAIVAIGHSNVAAQSAAQQCRAGARALGVARVVEIDATNGPRLGQMQYKDFDFLADREVVLTFDDGPSRAHTQAVLDALDVHCTKATFFMVGRMAVADPEMAREVDRRGHTVGTHTWSHAKLRALVPARAEAEIELGISAVARTLGKPIAPFFRFPYLADSRAMMAHLEKRNIALISIDIDSLDFRTHDGKRMQQNVMQRLAVQGKGIILMHDIQMSTAHGIGGLLDELKAKGYRVVHLVPKVPAATVASYDQEAASQLARKSAAAAANPLARRSVVWPMAPAAVPVPTTAVAKGKSSSAPVHGGPAAAAIGASSAAGAATNPPPSPDATPGLRGPADGEWSTRVFSR